MKLTKLFRLHIVLDDRIGSEERQRPVRAHLMKEAIREAIASERGHQKGHQSGKHNGAPRACERSGAVRWEAGPSTPQWARRSPDEGGNQEGHQRGISQARVTIRHNQVMREAISGNPSQSALIRAPWHVDHPKEGEGGRVGDERCDEIVRDQEAAPRRKRRVRVVRPLLIRHV